MRYTLNKAEIELSGYELFPSNFPGSARRGVIIYVRKKLQAVEVDIDTEFKESVWVKLNLKGNDKLLFGCVYKSPSSNEANLTALNGLISKVCDMNFSHIVTTGDFNYPDIDWELWNAKEESSLSFIECVRDNFLHQIIDHHTRERQEPSLLDLLLVNDNENIVNTKYLDPLGSSDHCVIEFNYRCYFSYDQTKNERLTYYKPNYDEMRKELDIDWEKELGDSNPIEMLNKVMEKLNKTIDKNIP